MKIAFYGGQIAGMITLLTLMAKGHEIDWVVPEDKNLKLLAKSFKLPLIPKSKLDNHLFIKHMSKRVDFFICCHGKKILSKEFVNAFKCINLHPCLYGYKGLHPIKRLIADANPRASVSSHWMSEKVDRGKKIVETFKIIDDISSKTEAGVYNELYPLYSSVMLKTLEKVITESH